MSRRKSTFNSSSLLGKVQKTMDSFLLASNGTNSTKETPTSLTVKESNVNRTESEPVLRSSENSDFVQPALESTILENEDRAEVCTTKYTTVPDDITSKGDEFCSKQQIKKLKSFQFPKSCDGAEKRCFQLKWLQKNPWIQYSIERDAAFCSICLQHGQKIRNETALTTTAYRNWRSALSKMKGFDRHEHSEEHIRSVYLQTEKRTRIESGASVSELVNASVLEKRRYYCRSIIEVIVFLAEHQLALRGNWDDEEREEEGLFNSMFQFTMRKDTRLLECQKAMPPNISYKSPKIQNEFISLLALILRESIAKEIVEADCGFFTILFDGTKDRNNTECVSIAVRFVSEGQPKEVLLSFESTETVDAEAFTKLILTSLASYGLDASKIISQCYDGAAVMNGCKSGVAKRLENVLKKAITYVHCFNHRLRLVIIDTIKRIQTTKDFFEQIQLIYTWMKKPKVKALYEGGAIKRLIDTRWTGHYTATKAIHSNYAEIVRTLQQVKNDNHTMSRLDGDDIAVCLGLHSVITQTKFVFTMVYMDEFLSILEPADAILQKREISYHRAVPVIDAVKSSIKEYRCSEKFEALFEKACKLMTDSAVTFVQPEKRARRRNLHLSKFSVEGSIGERANETDDIKSCFYEVIDVVLSEFDARFTENNSVLLAMSNSFEMDLQKLKPLEELGMKLPPEHELKTAKTFIETKKKDWNKEVHFNVLSSLYEVRDAFPMVYETYAFIETFGCSTAVCEASFSALSRIDIPLRLSMRNDRMRNLAFLAFENKRLQTISIERVLQKFNDLKDRRVQLF